MFFRQFALCATVTLACALAHADSYPTRPVKLIVGFAPGGANDAIARIIAQGLQKQSGQTVIVHNKPGAGGTLGADELAKAAPDGHTLLLGATGGQAIAPSIYDKLSYDPVKDILPVTLVATAATALVVSQSIPVRNLKELLAYAKAHPGKLNYASPGNGTGPHLTAELFKSMADIDIVHIPYRGDSPAMTDVISGQADMIFASLPSAISGLKTGKVRILAVTSRSRVKAMPTIPTVAEAGVPNFDVATWYGVFTTGGTPPAIVEGIAREVAKVLDQPDAQDAMLKQGVSPATNSPAEFRVMVNSEMERWGKVVRAVGIKPN